MSIRQFHVRKALVSYASLTKLIGELTEEEVLACLEFEAGTLRRRSTLDRLIARAVRLQELRYTRQLKEKFQWHANLPKS